MDWQAGFNAHPSTETLEEYVFKRISERATECLEEHLLLCTACQTKLREVDEYILLMKQATAARLAHPRIPEIHGWMRVLVAAATMLAAIGLAILLGVHRREPAAAPAAVQVELVAFRGEQMAHAGAGRPIDVVIDTTDLPGSNEYRVEVVNASGQLVWKGPAVAAEGRLSARLSEGLKRGVYWVRLSTSASELLREFGLRAD